MIKYLTEWLQWSYYHASLIPQTRYIKHVIILILLVYILAFFDIGGFLNGMSLFYLTKRQRQKKLRKCSFKESFTYSKSDKYLYVIVHKRKELAACTFYKRQALFFAFFI